MNIKIHALDGASLPSLRDLLPAGILDLLHRRPGDYMAMYAAADGFPCGAVVATPEITGIGLTQLYVLPGCRGLGIGSRLLDRLLIGLPETRGAKLICLFARAGGEDGRDAAFDYLSHRGFRMEEAGGGLFRTTLKALRDIPFWRQPPEAQTCIKAFRDLDPDDIALFNREMMCASDLAAAPYDEGAILPGVSHAITVNRRICGVAAVTGGREALNLAWLCCEKGFSMYLPALLPAVYASALLEADPDASLCVAALNESSMRLGRKLLPPESFHPILRAEADIDALRTDALARAHIGALKAGSEAAAWIEQLRIAYTVS
jgi:GNAT superfamily N-acetyltransferase